MRSKALRGLYVLRRQLRAAKTGRITQQSSLNTMARRVLVLAATAAALRPTLPRRSRTTTRAALTMHDYDYDVRSLRPCLLCAVAAWRGGEDTPAPRHRRVTLHRSSLSGAASAATARHCTRGARASRRACCPAATSAARVSIGVACRARRCWRRRDGSEK